MKTRVLSERKSETKKGLWVLKSFFKSNTKSDNKCIDMSHEYFQRKFIKCHVLQSRFRSYSEKLVHILFLLFRLSHFFPMKLFLYMSFSCEAKQACLDHRPSHFLHMNPANTFREVFLRLSGDLLSQVIEAWRPHHVENHWNFANNFRHE